MIDTHYNHANRLTQITTASGSTDYRYNAFDQRTHKITDSGTTYYLYDEAGLLLSEYNAQGDILKEYVWLNGEPLAQVVDGFVYYYHNDHLGTPQAMTDQDQNVVWQGHYTPFGDAAIVTDVVENNLRFPGQYYDQETGLHYNWHRYYDPAIGRYLTSDPLGLTDGPNTYGYVHGNPVNYFDPDGLECRIVRGRYRCTSNPRVGVVGCAGMYCAQYIQGDSNATGSIGTGGIGGAILICEEPPPEPEQCPNPDEPPSTPVSPPQRLGLIVGMQRNSDGTYCLSLGVMGDVPVGLNFSTGDI